MILNVKLNSTLFLEMNLNSIKYLYTEIVIYVFRVKFNIFIIFWVQYYLLFLISV